MLDHSGLEREKKHEKKQQNFLFELWWKMLAS